jgi:DNA topoisomerase-2
MEKEFPLYKRKRRRCMFLHLSSLIFCSLHPSFNICDEEEEITGYRNCFGAKIANMFSTSFVLEIASKEQGQRFKQEWLTNMTRDKIPEILTYSGSSFTEITFSLDLEKFKVNIF